MGPRVHPRLDRNGDNRIRRGRRVPLPDTCAELGKVETGEESWSFSRQWTLLPPQFFNCTNFLSHAASSSQGIILETLCN